MLKKLQEEKEEIKRDLNVAQSKRNIMLDNQNMEDLSQLLHEQDFFKELIKEEKDAIKQLDKEVEKLEKEIVNQNKQIKGLSGTEQAAAIEKQIRTLENRLEKASKDFNKMLTSNRHLREEIENLRIQRTMFDNFHKKLTKKLNDQKALMQSIIEQSSQAYDERDDAQAKIQALKEKNEKDLAQYNSEYRELMRIIDHDAKLKSFMNSKAHERNEAEEAQAAKRRAGETDKAEKTAREMIEAYERSFQKIGEITGEKDMYNLVKRFVETEEKNYALFTYINEMNGELKIVEDQVEQTRKEIKKYNESGVIDQTERQNLLKELEKKLEETTKQEERHAAQLMETEKVLEELKNGIEKVFNEINCDKSVLSKALGDNDKVTNENIMQYLSLIENKTNDLLQVHAYLQLKELENKPSDIGEPRMGGGVSLIGGPNAPPSNKQVNIPVPAVDDDKPSDDADRDETEDFDIPLTPEDLMKRASKRAAKMSMDNNQ